MNQNGHPNDEGYYQTNGKEMEPGSVDAAYNVERRNESENISNHEFNQGPIQSDEEPLEDYEVSDNEDNVEYPAIIPFQRHTAPIISGALHPYQYWAATSSICYDIYVWHAITGQVLFEKNHNQTIGKSEVYFSDDGNYLAMGNHTGKLFVYQIQTTSANIPIFQNILERSLQGISWMFWYYGVNTLIVAASTGVICIYPVLSGICTVLPTPGDNCNCGQLTVDNQKLYTSYDDYSLRLWDLNSYTVLMQVDRTHAMAHRDLINAVACNTELFISGSFESRVLFCNIDGPLKSLDAGGSVSFLSFSPFNDKKFIAGGTLSGTFTIWDYTETIRQHFSYDLVDAITDIKWLNVYRLAVTSNVGWIYVLSARSCVLQYRLRAHLHSINQMAYNLWTRVLLTVSDDQKARIWQLSQMHEFQINLLP